MIYVLRSLAALSALAALSLFFYGRTPDGDWPLLGQVWYMLSPGTLNLVQAVIERYVWVFLWDPLMLTLLQQPAFIAPALLALLLTAISLLWRSALILLALTLLFFFWT